MELVACRSPRLDLLQEEVRSETTSIPGWVEQIPSQPCGWPATGAMGLAALGVVIREGTGRRFRKVTRRATEHGLEAANGRQWGGAIADTTRCVWRERAPEDWDSINDDEP